MTVTTAGTGTTAREALQAGACSASCLLSRQETGRCRCTCRGRFHGILLRYLSGPEEATTAANRTTRRPGRRRR
jgi:hypothetical protein